MHIIGIRPLCLSGHPIWALRGLLDLCGSAYACIFFYGFRKVSVCAAVSSFGISAPRSVNSDIRLNTVVREHRTASENGNGIRCGDWYRKQKKDIHVLSEILPGKNCGYGITDVNNMGRRNGTGRIRHSENLF